MNNYLFIMEEDVYDFKHLYLFLNQIGLRTIESNDDTFIIGVTCSEDVAYEIADFEYVDEVINIGA